MHDELWAGVELKLNNANFHFVKMGRSLDLSQTTYVTVALQRSFYAYLDAFLSTTRSVAKVINCCFGHDAAPQIKGWFHELPSDEQKRRRVFSKDFKKDYDRFRMLPLSTVRHINVRRTGRADVTVVIHGMFGVIYKGSPINPVPISEAPPIDDPDRAFLVDPSPVQPMWSDFKIDGQGLFDLCSAYLTDAQNLINVAQGIAQQVHGTKALTAPLAKNP